ncbi:hypothetical protein PSAB6_420087 [Paraburkholderia sabiae]|nr:hypothetical protein PSAB6_420087 [Paraburkholderia sabiae]
MIASIAGLPKVRNAVAPPEPRSHGFILLLSPDACNLAIRPMAGDAVSRYCAAGGRSGTRDFANA